MSLRVPLQALPSRTVRTVSGKTRVAGAVMSARSAMTASGAPSTARGNARRSAADAGAAMVTAASAAISRGERAAPPRTRAWAADENCRDTESGAGGPATSRAAPSAKSYQQPSCSTASKSVTRPPQRCTMRASAARSAPRQIVSGCTVPSTRSRVPGVSSTRGGGQPLAKAAEPTTRTPWEMARRSGAGASANSSRQEPWRFLPEGPTAPAASPKRSSRQPPRTASRSLAALTR